jgi:3-oxoacyl-(acyl-carrier-protein) synthase
MAASLLAFSRGSIPFTLNYQRRDPLCPVQVVQRRVRPLGQPTALVLNQSTQGQSVAVALAGPEYR